jgi:hypothetical protein
MIDRLEVEVEVTAEDIANGKPGEASCCPIALAIRRAVEDYGVESVRVTRRYARIDGDKADMPPAGFDFVRYFDAALCRRVSLSPEERAEHVKPFKMTLVFSPIVRQDDDL